MTILLVAIDAKYIHTNNAVRLLQANSSFDVDILEYTIKDPVEDIILALETRRPDVVGFSVYIWNVTRITTLLRQWDHTNTTIILGGPEVSYDPEPFLRMNGVNYVVRGEGELVFEDLLHHIHNGTSPSELSNLAWLENDRVRINPIQEIKDLGALHPPYFRTEDLPHLQHKISYIESSRGCPYHCSYCLSSLEKTVRFFPLDDVKRAIDHLMEHGARTIKFLDRTFNANRNTMAILDHIMTRDNGETVFQFEITGDVLDEAIIHHIHERARPGLFRFEIGIQSTNDRTNHLVDRHQNTPKLFERIRQIQSAGIIDLHLDLIAGLPEEDLDSFIQTFNDVYRLGAKELQLGFLKMLRGTKIRHQADRFGYLFQEEAPYEIRSNNALSEQDISNIKLVEHMLELYHNKGYFGDNLKQLILKDASPYHFFLRLGQHYLSNNYPMHGYQLRDVYRHLIETLSSRETYLILQDYLVRSTVKPERFFESTVSKSLRNTILTELSTTEHVPLHLLYKHSVLLVHDTEYFCAYYHDHNCITYKGKAPD